MRLRSALSRGHGAIAENCLTLNAAGSMETEAVNQPRNKAEADARQRLVVLALSDSVRASRRRAKVSASKIDEICELS